LTPLVTTGELAERLSDVRVVDARWYLDPARNGRQSYLAGHIPGAVFLDVDSDLAAPGGARGGPLGRHPWPSAEQVARVMGKAGIDDGVDLVAYDDLSGSIAARVWFLLRAYGHDRVGVLDGGIPKWIAEGRALETGPGRTVPERVFVPRPRPGWVVTKEEVRAGGLGGPVLDARVPARYRGEVEPIDPRAGHIPGALNAPYTANVGPEGVFLPAAELRDHYAALGALRGEPVVYCGSGVNACHDLLALSIAGIRGRLYAGSWSEWSSDPSLPVERS
jgi:thiosulfate/3-mercaptopyruvate sulfurtransferase